MLKKGINRRAFGMLAVGTCSLLAAPSVLGKTVARVVVVGGGPAGVIAVQHLAASYPGIQVTLIEANSVYLTPFYGNHYLSGYRSLSSLSFDYQLVQKLRSVKVIHQRVERVDGVLKQVHLASGQTVEYDKLIMATGAGAVAGAIEGYDEAAETIFPHAYSSSAPEQWSLFEKQLQNMKDGGLVVMSVPKRPYQCTPAPYERASLIADFLKKKKPGSKLLILDGNDSFPLMDIMLDYWDTQYGENVEWMSAEFGGVLNSVDASDKSLTTDDGPLKPDVANIIPPQRAGRLLNEVGLVDQTGWCPIIPKSFESTLIKNIYVLGDAIEGGDMPKSAAAAASSAMVCATVIGNQVSGKTIAVPELVNACYFSLDQKRALHVSGRYRIDGERIDGIEGHASALGEDEGMRMDTAHKSAEWYKSLTRQMFGT